MRKKMSSPTRAIPPSTPMAIPALAPALVPELPPLTLVGVVVAEAGLIEEAAE
jgi:hypothetical protein